MNSNDIETVIVQDFWEEHIEKSKEDYDPYHYIADMNVVGEESLIDFNWGEDAFPDDSSEEELEEEEGEEEDYDD